MELFIGLEGDYAKRDFKSVIDAGHDASKYMSDTEILQLEELFQDMEIDDPPDEAICQLEKADCYLRNMLKNFTL